jgi:hypothetical protein
MKNLVIEEEAPIMAESQSTIARDRNDLKWHLDETVEGWKSSWKENRRIREQNKVFRILEGLLRENDKRINWNILITFLLKNR